MIICDYYYLWSLIGVKMCVFVKNIFIISSMNKWASNSKQLKRKIQDFYDFRILYKKITKAKIWGLKNLFSLLKFYKWLFLVHSSIGKWGGGGGRQLKTTKLGIGDFMI